MEQKSTSIFEYIIWAGAAVSVIGLIGIIWCILRVARARRANLEDQEMRDLLQSVLPINLGAMFLSVLGLMLVGLGIVFS